MTKSLDDSERQLAEATARVIELAEEIGLPDSPEKLATPHAIRLLARAHVALRDQVRALHDLVDQPPRSHLVGVDPGDPIGAALTKVGLALRPPDWKARGPRLVPTPVQVAGLGADQLAELYRRVMGGAIDFAKHETFVVRVWDGMDGCWSECTDAVPRDEALRYWAEKTGGGTHHVSFAEIDYYRIFPGGTRMEWDGSEGREMHR